MNPYLELAMGGAECELLENDHETYPCIAHAEKHGI